MDHRSSQGGYLTPPVSPDAGAHVTMSLEGLEVELAEAGKLLGELQQSIDLVLRPVSPSDSPSAFTIDCQPLVSPVAVRIQTSRKSVIELCVRLKDIMDRVDL